MQSWKSTIFIPVICPEASWQNNMLLTQKSLCAIVAHKSSFSVSLAIGLLNKSVRYTDVGGSFTTTFNVFEEKFSIVLTVTANIKLPKFSPGSVKCFHVTFFIFKPEPRDCLISPSKSSIGSDLYGRINTIQGILSHSRLVVKEYAKILILNNYKEHVNISANVIYFAVRDLTRHTHSK
ncbi:hypothetical protein V1478_011742 [Vespula squamosa]|uniref:Uncharacterized protein n=1 Tax=Vespula squamosa TaxID=30214 RepID=A0ABD2AB76_VESSQ